MSIRDLILANPGMSIEKLTEHAFSDGGPLQAAGFRGRQSQTDLALMVARAIDQGGWSAAEAPCGTGKSLAYLVPGVIAAFRSEMQADMMIPGVKEDARGVRRYEDGRYAPKPGTVLCALVSTANIALQEQLATKDAPAVGRALGFGDDLRVLVLKGRNNYACVDKINSSSLMIGANPIVARVKSLLESGSWSGDKEELTWDVSKDWHHVSVEARDCIGADCKFRGECPSELARQGLKRAHVVITNHHFLALGLAITPCLLAIDEAHELEEAVRSTRSSRIGRGSGKQAFSLARKEGINPDAIAAAEERIEEVFDLVARKFSNNDRDGTETVVGSEDWIDLLQLGAEEAFQKPDSRDEAAMEAERARMIDEVIEPISTLAQKLAGGGPLSSGDADKAAHRRKVAERLADTGAAIGEFLRGAVSQGVYDSFGECAIFAERQRSKKDDGTDRIQLNIVPAAVDQIVASISRRFPSAILTSATLAAGDNGIESFAHSIGFRMPTCEDEEVECVLAEAEVLPSPFDLPNQGLLVVPHGPGPKEVEWKDYAESCVIEAVNQARGRTLVLCSTLAAVKRYTEILKVNTNYSIRAQGEAGRGELRKWFAEDVEGVLVASRSFFQGLDVSGESCSCVVIDRIPFAPPGDPVEDAVGRHLADLQGEKATPFGARSLPRACLALAQGAGRLIRTATDRGVVVLLDSRAVDGSRMGKTLRSALPPFPLSRDIEDVGRFLNQEPLQGVARSGGGVSNRRRRGAA